MQALSSRRGFWVLWFAVFAIKAVLAVRLPLFGDEAWYWLEGQHPAVAYSDLPGLTAWLIRVGVELGGHSTLGVRWPFLLLAMAVPLLLRASAERWFGIEAGLQAGTLALLLPLLGGLGFLALPDVPLTFAAALCLHASLHLTRAVDARAAVWLGLGLIVGALSHYRFALLIVAGFCGLLLDAGGRRALSDRRVWLAIVAGALAWLPLLLWNLRHEVAGLSFQLAERHPWSFHADGAWLPLSQVLLVSPLLLGLLLLALRQTWRHWRIGSVGAWGVILGASAVPMVIYVALGFFADRERVTFHWLLQAYLPLLVVAPTLLARWSLSWRRATTVVAALGLLGVFAYGGIAAAPALRERFADSRWYPDNFSGWREIAAALQHREKVLHDPIEVVADNFMLGAQLAFALRQPELTVLDHPLNHKHGRALQLALWKLDTRLDQPPLIPRLLVTEDSATPLRKRLARYHDLCEQAGALPPPQVLNVDHGRKRFLLFALGATSGAKKACVPPALAWVDLPAPRAVVGTNFEVAGWAFKDGVGIERVEITLDGSVVATADYGIASPQVAAYWRISTDPAHPRVGFHARIDVAATAAGDHWLGLVLHGRDGSIERWPEQRLRIKR